MAEVRTVPIKELYHGLYDGPHATPTPADRGPVFLGIGNVTDDGRMDLSSIRHIAEEEFGKWTRRVEPQANDLVFTYEATLNRYAIIPEGFRGCLGRRMALIRTNPAKVDHRWLHYYFFSPAWREVIKNNMLSGSTVDRIPLTTFPNYPVQVPDLPTQRRIAGILSAYDELIANNQRRIAVLEQMARALYREWFVYFRAPGVVMNDGEELPEGWEVKRLKDITTKIGSGATPRGGKGAYHTEGISLIRSMNVYDDRFLVDDLAFINDEQAEALSNVSVERNDILLNITGASVARCCMAPAHHLPARVNQHVAIIRVNDALTSSHYVLDSINSPSKKQHLLSIAQAGATREALTKEAIENVEINLPPKELTERYEAIAAPMFEQRELLVQQTANLRRTRDLLLPRLMSGRVEEGALEEELK